MNLPPIEELRRALKPYKEEMWKQNFRHTHGRSIEECKEEAARCLLALMERKAVSEMVLLPLEPTDDMIQAAFCADGPEDTLHYKTNYDCMINAYQTEGEK